MFPEPQYSIPGELEANYISTYSQGSPVGKKHDDHDDDDDKTKLLRALFRF